MRTAPDHPLLGRYHRQTLVGHIGPEGQRTLADSHAIIIGTGATGGSIADLLARGGVGRLTLIDRDLVELTNLQRQPLFDEASIGEPKAAAAAERIRSINSTIRVDPVVLDLTHRTVVQLPIPRRERADTATEASPSCDDIGRTVLIDGTDNFETRFLINDLAVSTGVPFVYAGVIASHGMCMPLIPGHGPCLRCLFDGPPPPASQPTCDTAGVLGPAVAMVAGSGAMLAIKMLLGKMTQAQLTRIDAWTLSTTSIDVTDQRDDACPCCVARRFDFLDGSRAASGAATLCGQDAVQIAPPLGSGQHRADLDALHARLAGHGSFVRTPFLVRGTLAHEPADAASATTEPRHNDIGTTPRIALTVFADGRAIVKGTTRSERARAIYDRYLGS